MLHVYIIAFYFDFVSNFERLPCQVYVGTISPARDTNASYIAWGHSSVVSPWGEVVSTCEEEEAIVYADLGKFLSFFQQV